MSHATSDTIRISDPGKQVAKIRLRAPSDDLEVHLSAASIGRVMIYNAYGVHIGTLHTASNTYEPVAE